MLLIFWPDVSKNSGTNKPTNSMSKSYRSRPNKRIINNMRACAKSFVNSRFPRCYHVVAGIIMHTRPLP